MLTNPIIVFLLGFFTDFVWAKWAKNVKEYRPILAANWSVLIFLCNLFYTLLIIEKSFGLISLYLVGCWVGTYIGVKYSKC
jgi:hypothetical protein